MSPIIRLASKLVANVTGIALSTSDLICGKIDDNGSRKVKRSAPPSTKKVENRLLELVHKAELFLYRPGRKLSKLDICSFIPLLTSSLDADAPCDTSKKNGDGEIDIHTIRDLSGVDETTDVMLSNSETNNETNDKAVEADDFDFEEVLSILEVADVALEDDAQHLLHHACHLKCTFGLQFFYR